MAPQLCKVCCSIPSDFWLGTFDQMEYCQEPFVELQSFNQMRTTAAKGCELCAILLKSPYMDKMNDENTTLYLRRSLACPERAVTLGKGAKGALHLSRTFFYRIPGWWWGELCEDSLSRRLLTCSRHARESERCEKPGASIYRTPTDKFGGSDRQPRPNEDVDAGLPPKSHKMLKEHNIFPSNSTFGPASL